VQEVDAGLIWTYFKEKDKTEMMPSLLFETLAGARFERNVFFTLCGFSNKFQTTNLDTYNAI